MTLVFCGLGLNPEDLTQRMHTELKKADIVYLDGYTSIFSSGVLSSEDLRDNLSQVLNRPIVLAERHLLEWQAWLEGEYIDLIIPRVYVGPDEPLAPIVADWRTVIGNSNRIVLGLKVYTRQQDHDMPKPPDRMLSEIDLVRASGSGGVVLFDIEHTSDDMLQALATGPFSSSHDTK